ncbi:MAG: hypothetical protein HY537_07170 [Deltaproteobacteria bacterium]|nr:hypothetical protein [Deltaproteobacteria bacterium]
MGWRFQTFLACIFLYRLTFALEANYLSAEHPEGWDCERLQGIWICQARQEPLRKESLILSIATVATAWDSLENYLDYLKKSRPIVGEDGAKLLPQITYSRKHNISGQEWVDSLQFNSELPGFWTRYVATILQTNNGKYAILITYIVSDEFYKQMAPQFERMIATLRLNNKFDTSVVAKDGAVATGEKLGRIQKDIIADRLKPRKKEPLPVQEPAVDSTVIIAAVIVTAALAYLFFKRRKRKKL